MRLNDTALGLLVAALGAALLVAALQLPGVRGQAFGAGFFPSIIGGLVVMAGLGIAAGGWRRGGPVLTTAAWLREPWALTNIGILAGSIALFALVGDRVGFLPFAAALIWLVQWRMGAAPLRAAVIAAPGAVLFQLLFAKLLRVPLPQGVLAGWL